MRNRQGVHGLRRGRFSEIGRVYLLSTVTRDREPVFCSLPAARAVIRALATEDAEGFTRTLAYVLMPDHLHWLVELSEPIALARLMQAIKSVSAHRIGAPVWQPGFHDRALRAEEDLAAVARYVVANPLRAGLVDDLVAYPHWDTVWLQADGGRANPWAWWWDPG